MGVIHTDLTGGPFDAVDLTGAARLAENAGVAFMGDTKGGAFDITGDVAREMLLRPTNVNGRPNSDVVVPWVNGLDVTRRPRGMFIIDFGVDRDEQAAAAYEAPFSFIEEHVRPVRATNARAVYRERWWLHVESRPAFRTATRNLSRFIGTPRVAKYRLFTWMRSPTLPDSQIIAIAREDDYAFGVLHSRAHELWSLRKGTWLGKGNDPRYTPTSTFETFPFPWPLNTPDEALTSEQAAHRDAIAEAARSLDAQREAWLNPEELVRREPDVLPSLPERVLPRDEEAAKVLAKRTLTNLYNERPHWLVLAHAALDAAVLAAYGWASSPSEPPLDDEELLRRLLALNLQRAGGAST